MCVENLITSFRIASQLQSSPNMILLFCKALYPNFKQSWTHTIQSFLSKYSENIRDAVKKHYDADMVQKRIITSIKRSIY